MPLFTILTSLVLEGLGLYGYFSTGGQSPTALIPCVFGTLLLLCGVLAYVFPRGRRHALHAAAAVSLLGFVGIAFRVVPKIPSLLSGEPVSPSATAVILQLVFAAVCLVYFAVCFRSFWAARMARRGASGPSQ